MEHMCHCSGLREDRLRCIQSQGLGRPVQTVLCIPRLHGRTQCHHCCAVATVLCELSCLQDDQTPRRQIRIARQGHRAYSSQSTCEAMALRLSRHVCSKPSAYSGTL